MAYTHTNTTEEKEYLVVHCDTDHEGHCDFIEIFELDPGNALGTGQKHVEIFTVYEEALARAVELGYVLPEKPDLLFDLNL